MDGYKPLLRTCYTLVRMTTPVEYRVAQPLVWRFFSTICSLHYVLISFAVTCAVKNIYSVMKDHLHFWSTLFSSNMQFIESQVKENTCVALSNFLAEINVLLAVQPCALKL